MKYKDVSVEVTPTEAIVEGASLTSGDRSTIQTVIDGYTFVAPPLPGLRGIQGPQGVPGNQGDIGPPGAPGTTDWNGLTNRPATFTPTTHSHAISDVTTLQTTLNGKAASTHTHAAADVTSGTLAIAQIPTGATSTTVSLGDHTHAQPAPTYAALANGTTTMALATNNTVKVTPTATATYTTTVPAAGTRCQIIILTSGVLSFTITFGSGFKSTGTLATGTTASRVFVLIWISDGTNLYEAGRTAAMVA